MSMQGKHPSASAINNNVYKIFPNDLNAERTVFSGLVMALCDRIALIVAERHSGKTCVTASVDNLNFLAPARAGETLILKSAINRAWNSSMEIGVNVSAENSYTGESRSVLSAYLTFVALDEHDRPTKVPEVLPETDEESRRFSAAQIRRDARLLTRQSVSALESGNCNSAQLADHLSSLNNFIALPRPIFCLSDSLIGVASNQSAA